MHRYRNVAPALAFSLAHNPSVRRLPVMIKTAFWERGKEGGAGTFNGAGGGWGCLPWVSFPKHDSPERQNNRRVLVKIFFCLQPFDRIDVERCCRYSPWITSSPSLARLEVSATILPSLKTTDGYRRVRFVVRSFVHCLFFFLCGSYSWLLFADVPTSAAAAIAITIWCSS